MGACECLHECIHSICVPGAIQAKEGGSQMVVSCHVDAGK